MNGDGVVNMADALLIQQVVDGKRDLKNDWDMAPLTAGFANGDVNYDGATNATDVRIIMEYCAGLRALPAAPVDDEGHEYSQRFTYYHDDHLGSTGIVTDRCGNIVQQITYTPYGEMRSELNLGASVNYLYTGHEFDREVGLYYYGARYYDQSIGRFISPDTVIPNAADSQSYNRYAYCLNNPILYNDPTGHEPVASKPHPAPPQTPPPKVEPQEVQPPTPVAATVDQIFVELGGTLPTTKTVDPANARLDKGKWTTQDANALQASKDVYKKDGGFEAIKVEYKPKDGFAAGLSKKDGVYYCAMRGTEGLLDYQDMKANGAQAFRLTSSQYEQAMALAKDVFKATGGNVIFTGHSLGGGLASAAATVTGGRAITFNAAGLSSHTASGTPGDIRAHYVRGDILTTMQVVTPLPNAVGTSISHRASHWYTGLVGRHSLDNFKVKL